MAPPYLRVSRGTQEHAAPPPERFQAARRVPGALRPDVAGPAGAPRGEWELSVLTARLADMTVIWMLTLVIGLIVGTVMGFLVARNREAAKAVDLAARASAADERARAAEQRAALVDGQLAERFQVLSAQALDASARRFLEMAEGRLSAANAKAAG